MLWCVLSKFEFIEDFQAPKRHGCSVDLDLSLDCLLYMHETVETPRMKHISLE